MGARAEQGKPRGPLWRLEHGLATLANFAPTPLRARQGGLLSITFDDFPRTAWTQGAQVLAAHGAKATYYVCGGHEGGVFEGQEQFTRADLEACVASGHEIGCHGFNHLAATAPARDRFETAVEANRLYLLDRIGREATHFAYPYGYVSFRAKTVAAQRFVTARGVRGGFNRARVDRALIRAEGFESRKLARQPIAPLLAKVAACNGWLVLYSHDVSDRPSPFGCSPDDLHALLKLADTLGLTVATMSQAAALLGLSEGSVTAQERPAGAQHDGHVGAQGPALQIAPVKRHALREAQA
jgi:peptidoglycan/xylan/chitin deacetylase (PgdA/CDA1 family)